MSRGGFDPDALDDLNLDDMMFGEAGDNLFDGLDIDLDEGVPGASPFGALPPPPPRRGPKTNRPPPPPEPKAPKAAPPPLPAPLPPRAARRKAKRTSKALEQDSQSVEDSSNKRKKSSIPTISNKRSKKKTSAAKGDSKDETSLPRKGMGIPGPFVGRAPGHASATHKRAALPTNKRKKKVGGVNDRNEPPIPKLPLDVTFCGLHPSRTIFYPFLPALPSEPSLKSRKSYPAVDKLALSLTTLSADKNLPAGISLENSPIYQLLNENFQTAEKQWTPEKSKQLHDWLVTWRQKLRQADLKKFSHDIAVLMMLAARQHTFLSQNLQNLQHWCQDNFSPDDYAQTYGKSKKASGSRLLNLNGTLMRIKLVGESLGLPSNAGPLLASIPLPSKYKKSQATLSQKASSTAAAASGGASSAPSAPTKPWTYLDATPQERLQHLADAIRHQAILLESQVDEQDRKRKQALDSRSDRAKRVVDANAHVLQVHTQAMWSWLEASGHGDWENGKAKDAMNELDEISPPPVRMTLPKVRTVKSSVSGSDGISTNSLFQRLQSLLVEEDRASDDDSDSGSDSDDDDDGPSARLRTADLHALQGSQSLDDVQELDLSNFSLEERAFLHLKAAGVVQSSVFPTVRFVEETPEVEDDDAADQSPIASFKDVRDRPEDAEFGQVLGAMADDLEATTERNQERIAFLKANAALYGELSLVQKKEREKETALAAKCQALIQKRAKSGSKKPAAAAGGGGVSKKNEHALPW